jgi:predicted Zn-dependent peptidase
VQRHTLANGVSLWLSPVPSARLVELRLVVAAPFGKQPGVSRLTAAMVASGNGFVSGVDAFASALRGVGGTIEARTDRLGTVFALAVQPAHAPRAIELLGHMLKLRRMKARGFNALRAAFMGEAAAQGRDDVDWLVDEAAWRTLFAGDVARPSAHELSRVRLTESRSFFERHYAGAALTLVVVGNVAAPAALEAAKRGLGKLPAARQAHAQPPRPATSKGPFPVLLIDRPGQKRARVHVATAVTAAAQRADAALELIALRLATAGTAVDGDGDRLRLQRGTATVLAIERDVDAGGAVAAARAMREALERKRQQLQRLPPSHGEKRRLRGAFVRQTDGARRIADQLATLSHFGAPAFGLEQRLASIDTLATRQLRTALARHEMKPVVVVVGDRELLLEPLRALGEARVVAPLNGFKLITSRPASTQPSAAR